MDKFWELFAKSVVVQAILAVSFGGAIIYMAIAGKPIPEILVNAEMLIFGWYFGSKQTQASIELAKAIAETVHKE